MNTLRVLASPRVWGPVLGLVAVLALIFYAYLGAVVSPEENLDDFPIALVNEDRGGNSVGKRSTSVTGRREGHGRRIHLRPAPSGGRGRTHAARRSRASATRSTTVPS